MAAHSSILAWRIPCTEGPGGPQSMGWQRVGLDLAPKPQPGQEQESLRFDTRWGPSSRIWAELPSLLLATRGRKGASQLNLGTALAAGVRALASDSARGPSPPPGARAAGSPKPQDCR